MLAGTLSNQPTNKLTVKYGQEEGGQVEGPHAGPLAEADTVDEQEEVEQDPAGHSHRLQSSHRLELGSLPCVSCGQDKDVSGRKAGLRRR